MIRRGYMRRLVLLLAAIGCGEKGSSWIGTNKDAPPRSPSNRTIVRLSSCGEEIITDRGIGELRIGSNVDHLRQKCNMIRDTTALGAEGMPARKVSFALSADTVEAEIVNGRVWRIAVVSPGLRTEDSLGVGTSIGRLRQLRSPRLMTGEGALFVATPDYCGMSFRLSNTGPDALRGNSEGSGLSRLPKSAVVSEVLVFGCR